VQPARKLWQSFCGYQLALTHDIPDWVWPWEYHAHAIRAQELSIPNKVCFLDILLMHCFDKFLVWCSLVRKATSTRVDNDGSKLCSIDTKVAVSANLPCLLTKKIFVAEDRDRREDAIVSIFLWENSSSFEAGSNPVADIARRSSTPFVGIEIFDLG
jgi:hypothetical protein